MNPLVLQVLPSCQLRFADDKSIMVNVAGHSRDYFFEKAEMLREQTPIEIKETEEMIEKVLSDHESEIQVTTAGEHPITLTIKKGHYKDFVQLIFSNKNNRRLDLPVYKDDLRKMRRWLELFRKEN